MEFKDCYLIIDETVDMDEDLFQICFSEALESMIVYLHEENINALSINTQTNFQKRVYWKAKQIIEEKGLTDMELNREKGYRMLESADAALFFITNMESEAAVELIKARSSGKRTINLKSHMNYEKYEKQKLYYKICDRIFE